MSIPTEIRRAYGLAEEGKEAAARHIPSLINLTYVVQRRMARGLQPLVLQRLHSVFGAQVHFDIEAVTAQLAARGLSTPRLIRTREGALWAAEATAPDRIWRALTYLEGRTLHGSSDPRCLNSAARLLARFHAALFDLPHEFVHHRPLHDTRRHMANLEAALASDRGRADADARRLGEEILREADAVRWDYSAFPLRVIHGDPKLSNIMFDAETGLEARAMVDLDTLGRGPLAHELGDALRSWCNSAGEDTPAPRIELEAFRAVMAGYVSARAVALAPEEVLSAVDGLQTISLELASRFAADAIRDAYFGWDPSRFATRREHNLLRARGQLSLHRSARASDAELRSIAREALASRSGVPA